MSEIGRESVMAVQDPQCCGLNGRSLKGNRGLGPDGGKAMLDAHQPFRIRQSRETCEAKVQRPMNVSSCRRTGTDLQVRQARHISLPLSWFQGILRACAEMEGLAMW